MMHAVTSSDAVRSDGLTESSPERRVVSGAGIWIVAVAIGILIGLAALGLHDMSLPSAVPASVAPSVFSAERAIGSVRRFATRPHALGTPEDAEVRDGLMSELRSLGYDPQIQATLAISRESSVAGYVHNIVARIPGVVHGKALMLAAHYDSVPTGPGAADDGASVAAILETVRALRASPRLRNDIIVLFTDGEEPGLLGAEGFVAGHPWGPDVGVVLNFDFRGNSGPILMFESSDGNGKLIEALGSVPHPVANSLMYEIYRLLPNSTDMTVFKRAGLPGMNFAAIEQPFSYHTALDRPELLDRGTLQHEGETMLALARRFGDADLNVVRADNRIYFDVPGLGLVSYSAAFGLAAAGMTVLLWVAVIFVGIRKNKISGARILGAALVLPVSGFLLAAFATLLWVGITAIHPQYRVLPEIYNALWYRLSFVALATGSFVVGQSALRRWFRPMDLAVGAASFWVLLLSGCLGAFPGASFILTWPLLPVLMAWLYLLSAAGGKLTDTGRLLLLLGAATPAVVLFASVLYVLLVALTLNLIAVPVFVLVLLLGILWPLLVMLRREFLFPTLPFLVGIGFLVMGSMTAAESISHPRHDSLFYLENCNAGTAQWVSTNRVLDPWQKLAFGGTPIRHRMPELFGTSPRMVWSSAAPNLGVRCPDITVLQDNLRGDLRTVRLHLQSRREAPVFKLNVADTEILSATLQGRPVMMNAPRKEWAFAAYGMPPEGFDLEMTVRAGQAFVVRAFDKTYGLPPAVLTPRGPGLIAQGAGESDSVQALTAVTFK